MACLSLLLASCLAKPQDQEGAVQWGLLHELYDDMSLEQPPTANRTAASVESNTSAASAAALQLPVVQGAAGVRKGCKFFSPSAEFDVVFQDLNWVHSEPQWVIDDVKQYWGLRPDNGQEKFRGLKYVLRSFEKHGLKPRRLVLLHNGYAKQTYPKWLNWIHPNVSVLSYEEFMGKDKYVSRENATIALSRMYRMKELTEWFLYLDDSVLLNKHWRINNVMFDSDSEQMIYYATPPIEDKNEKLSRAAHIANEMLSNKYGKQMVPTKVGAKGVPVFYSKCWLKKLDMLYGVQLRRSEMLLDWQTLFQNMLVAEELAYLGDERQLRLLVLPLNVNELQMDPSQFFDVQAALKDGTWNKWENRQIPAPQWVDLIGEDAWPGDAARCIVNSTDQANCQKAGELVDMWLTASYPDKYKSKFEWDASYYPGLVMDHCALDVWKPLIKRNCGRESSQLDV